MEPATQEEGARTPGPQRHPEPSVGGQACDAAGGVGRMESGVSATLELWVEVLVAPVQEMAVGME